MAQTFCTGPAHIGFATGVAVTPSGAAGGTSIYYGTTRTGPDITEEPSYFNVMNDLAGPNLPFDRGYAGSEHTITLEMTRWHGNVDVSLDATPFEDLTSGVEFAGMEYGNDRGKLVSKSSRLSLLMVLSNSNIGTPTADFLSIKYRLYYQVVNIGPNKPIMGNKENIRVRIFKAQNVFLGIADVNNLNQNMFALFEEDTGASPITMTVT